jgi:uncharacterized membrane protein YebE (DUF533 family)
MANWLNQLQSLLGQQGQSSSSSGGQDLGKLLVPGALGGLAGLLVASKSSRKLLTKYGTSALLVGGGAVAGSVLWNKYKDKVRAAHQGKRSLVNRVRLLMRARNALFWPWCLPRRAMDILMTENVPLSNNN